MHPNNRYDSLIQHFSAQFDLDWQMICRQVETESAFRPQARSPVGAVGLMQFMPGTWSWAWKKMRAKGLVGDDYEPWIRNPEDSIFAGCWYDRWLYGRYGEIPDDNERWKFALAAYNCGRGNLNQTIHIARKEIGKPASFAAWDREGRKPGPWQKWAFTSRFLSVITGDHANETIGYIKQIMGESA